MDEYNVPASRVVRHFDVTGKHCPNGYVSAKAWKNLHSRLTNPIPKYPTVVLKKGDQGVQVMSLQMCMNKLINADLDVDGDFGKKTAKAVVKFKNKYVYKPSTSKVGKKTLAKIKELMK